MKWIPLAFVAIGGTLCGSPALAAQMYTVSLKSLGGADPVTFTARFSDKYVVDWGDTGYQVAGAAISYGTSFGPYSSLPLSGDQFWRIDVAQYTYGVVPETDEFFPIYNKFNDEIGEYLFLRGPALIFKDGRVAGLVAQGDIYNDYTPVLKMSESCCIEGVDRRYTLGSGYIDDRYFSPLPTDPRFEINDFHLSGTPGWIPPGPVPSTSGVWDYANSTVIITPVPEPATWAVMLLGFGGAGAMLRRRRRRGVAAV